MNSLTYTYVILLSIVFASSVAVLPLHVCHVEEFITYNMNGNKSSFNNDLTNNLINEEYEHDLIVIFVNN